MTNKKLGEDLSELHDIGFDFFEGKYQIIGHIERVVDTAFSSHYDKDGVEWINWFMYESEYGQKNWSQDQILGGSEEPKSIYGARDKDGNPICYSYDSLWKYVEEYHRLYSRYTEKLELDGGVDNDIYTVDEWERELANGKFCISDGCGYWVKNGLKSVDDVFSAPKFDATHVIWYDMGPPGSYPV